MKDSTQFDERFDRFTKSLASPTPRRRVLKGIVSTLVGAVLAPFVPTEVFADNSACAHFCASVFGAGTKAAGQCTSVSNWWHLFWNNMRVSIGTNQL